MNKLYCTLVLLSGTTALLSHGVESAYRHIGSYWSNGLPANGSDAFITETELRFINSVATQDFRGINFGDFIIPDFDIFNRKNVVRTGGYVLPGADQFFNTEDFYLDS